MTRYEELSAHLLKRVIDDQTDFEAYERRDGDATSLIIDSRSGMHYRLTVSMYGQVSFYAGTNPAAEDPLTNDDEDPDRGIFAKPAGPFPSLTMGLSNK